MKQGTAKESYSTKHEPVSRAVNPAYPGQLGAHFGNHADEGDTPRIGAVPMYEGRGLSAPMVSETSYPAGSQGKHK